MINVTFSIEKTANKQRELWVHVRVFGKLLVSRRIFTCHVKQHKVIRDMLCALRYWTWRKPVALLAATVTPPASAVASPAVLSTLAQKSNDKFAQVTQRIMASDKPRKASFKTPAHTGRPVISSVYRDSLHAVTTEAGI